MEAEAEQSREGKAGRVAGWQDGRDGRSAVRGCGTTPRNASRVYNFNKHQSGPESPQAASHEAIRILASGTVLMGPRAAAAKHCAVGSPGAKVFRFQCCHLHTMTHNLLPRYILSCI